MNIASIKHDIRETAKDCYNLSDRDMELWALCSAANEVASAWDGEGWYDLMSGASSMCDPIYVEDCSYLGAAIYKLIVASTPVNRDGDHAIVYALKVTDADEIAELESMYW